MSETPRPMQWWRDRKRLLAALRRDRFRLGAIVWVAVLVLGIGAFLVYRTVRRPPDVHNENAVFVPKETKVHRIKTVDWPLYGYDRARTHYLPAKGIKPPFKRRWKYGSRPLLEFPPIYVKGTLYGIDNNGHVFALDADTGKVLWKRRVAQLNASAPAYSHHRIFVSNLVPGQVLALNAKNGRTEWRKELGSRTESSPLAIGNRVYFGDEAGSLYAVDRRNGHTIWTAQLTGAIKAAPAYHHGILFVGDYGGTMNAVNSHTGKIKWQSGSQGVALGGTGEFYSTPAVAFGRVYSGNNDSRVYSFQEKDGSLAWSHSTGGYVYSSPTVANTQNTPPTVYVGSYDGNLYAIDAKSGETRWYQSAGGRIIGSPSAVGQIVYVAEFDNTTTTGFAMKSGRKVFDYGTGAYQTMISDGKRLYLTGYSSITALQPVTHHGGKHAKGKGKQQHAKGANAKARQRHRNANRRQRRAHHQSKGKNGKASS